MMNYGSSVCVGKARNRNGDCKSVWITCAHVVETARVVELEINRQWVPANVLRTEVDQSPDLALVQCDAVDVDCVSIAEHDARIGDVVELHGSPQGAPIRMISGRVDATDFARIRSVSGDSGGALTNEKGQLIGINWGGVDGHCVYTRSSVIQGWLNARWGGVPRCDCEDTEKPVLAPLPIVDRPVKEPETGIPVSGKPGDPQPPKAPAVIPQEPDATDSPSWLERLVKFAGLGATIAGVLGLGTVTGGAGLALAPAIFGVVASIFKRKKPAVEVAVKPVDVEAIVARVVAAIGQRTVEQKPPIVLTVDTPPGPQQVTTQTQFATVEKDTLSEAFAWAAKEVTRKYPGSVSTVETLQSFMNQYLAGQGHPGKV